MISYRRHRYPILTILLIVLVVWYIFTGKESTRSSAFYRKTAEAIDRRRNEGPQAYGSTTKPFLKGGSVRPEVPPEPIDTDPIDMEESLEAAVREIDEQLGKKQDLVSEVEAMDKGLEDPDAHSRAGRTEEDLELERQIIAARKREQVRLKEEIKNQMKHKERERQNFLTSGKVVNPNWVGAFEKERKPLKGSADGELERAPGLDPFRDKDSEAAPDEDPYRDKKPDVPLEQEEDENDQQIEKLVKEQELLEPVAGEREIDGDIEKPALRKAVPLRDDSTIIDDDLREGVAQLQSKNTPAMRDEEPAAPLKKAGGLRRPAVDVYEEEEAEDKIKPAAPKGTKQQPLVKPGVPQVINKGKAPATTTSIKKAVAPQKTTTTTKAAAPKPPAHKTPAELELSRLLALSPITIFSKSWCPHSKDAKKVLLEQMEITPTPYVVELDKHELGGELQQLLKEKTGRGTVPNIMVEGVSLGGGDDVRAFFRRGELIDKLKDMGGKRVLRVTERKEEEEEMEEEEGYDTI